MAKHLQTKDGIIVVLLGTPYTVPKTDPKYQEILNAILDWTFLDNEVLDIINRPAKKFKAYAELNAALEYDGGIIYFNGQPMEGYAVDKLIEMVETDKPFQPLANFLAKIQANPSFHVIEHLYAFMEKGDISLTQGGNILVYKAVRKDYNDIHSGKFSNTIGSVQRIPRNKVDDNRDKTCSYGFHVCSFNYLPSFAHADGHVIICEVNPADVVAIPNDYNDSKMRVCAYSVVGEVEGYYREAGDVLAEIGVQEGEYEEEVLFDYEEDFVEFGGFDSFEEAKERALQDLEEYDDVKEIRIKNPSGKVIFTVTNGD